MSSSDEIMKAEKEKEAKEKARKIKIATKKYSQEKEHLKRRSFTSFGKLILSDEASAPVINFPLAKKFNKAGAPTSLNTPGPIYTYDNQFKYSNVFFLIFNKKASRMEYRNRETPTSFKLRKVRILQSLL